MSKQIKNTSAKLFRIVVGFCIVVIMGVLGTPPVKAQMESEYGSSNFADVWSDLEDPSPYIMGFGSTEAWYNSWNHESRVILNFLAPDGNYCTYDSNFTGGYASGHVSFPFDENNLGFYNLSADHRNWCPQVSREFAQAYTSQQINTGKSTICKVNTGEFIDGNIKWCEYEANIPNCIAKCSNINLTDDFPMIGGPVTCPLRARVRYRWTEITDQCGCKTSCVYITHQFLNCNACTDF